MMDQNPTETLKGLLDELEKQIRTGRSRLAQDEATVSPSRLCGMIEEIRNVLVAAFAESNEILRQQDAILREAEDEAERIAREIQQAKGELNTLRAERSQQEAELHSVTDSIGKIRQRAEQTLREQEKHLSDESSRLQALASQNAEGLVENARQEAEKLLTDARAEIGELRKRFQSEYSGMAQKAQSSADHIIWEAQQKAKAMVEDHNLVLQAEQRAAQIIAAAEGEAAKYIVQARKDTDDLLAETTALLLKQQDTISRLIATEVDELNAARAQIHRQF